MKIDKFFREDHTVKLTVELEVEPFEEAKKRAARQISRRTRIPGFRPGKAPYPVVVRSVGESVIVQEAMDLLLDDVYPKIIEESELKPYTSGTLENILSLDPPTLEFSVPLAPVVGLPEYHNIRLPYELKPVTEEDVTQVLEDLRDRYATFEPVDRPTQEGDQVSLRLRAERKNPVEGKELNLINDRQTVLTVKPEDNGAISEWPFPGFSLNLIGMAAGDEKSFEYTYPEDSDLENLRGTEAIYYIKVEAVKLRKLPDLNDEFAQTVGEYESLDSLRSEILNGLTDQRKNDYDNDYHNQIIDEILKEVTIKYPPQMLERELHYFKHQLEDRLSQQNLDMATYLKTRQMTEEDLEKELLPSAEKRLQRSLVIMEVARLESIQVDEQEVQSQAINTINQIQQVYKDEARRIVTQEFISNVIANITSDQMVQKTLDRLSKIAKGEFEVQTEESEAAPPPDASTDLGSPTEPGIEPASQLSAESQSAASQVVEKVKKPAKKRKTRKETE